MSDGTIGIALVVLYRLAALVTGALFAYFGYNLFRLGVYEKAGELEAKWKGFELTLRQAAPGTFFAVLGVVLIAVSLWRQGTMIEGRLTTEPQASTTAVVEHEKITEVPQPIVTLFDNLTDKGYLDDKDLAMVNDFLNKRVRVGYVKKLIYTVNHYVPEIPSDTIEKLVDGKKIDGEEKASLLVWYLQKGAGRDDKGTIKSMVIDAAMVGQLTKVRAMQLRDHAMGPVESGDQLQPATEAAPAPPAPTATDNNPG